MGWAALAEFATVRDVVQPRRGGEQGRGSCDDKWDAATVDCSGNNVPASASTGRVTVYNTSSRTTTVIKVDSANRRGSLLEVVQVLTDVNLIVRRAYISSDGEWFMDAPLPGSQETKTREKSSGTSSVPDIADGSTTVESGTASVDTSLSSTGSVDRISPSAGGNNSLSNNFPSDNSDKGATVAFGSESVSSTSDCLGSRPASSSAVCFSSSDPVLVPSIDSRFPGDVGAIKREVGSQRPPGELNVVHTSENKTAGFETGNSSLQGKIQGESPVVAKNHVPEVSSSSMVIHGSTSVIRPSSNYSNRSQQIIGHQKAGSNKEWKPKPTNTINQGSGPATVSESSAVSAEETGQLPSVSKVLDSEEATSKLQRKLEDLHLPPRQHVILPNHILVPDSEKSKFSFGSLGVTFGVTSTGTTSCVSDPESEKGSTPLSKVSQAVEETAGEQASRL